MDKSPSKVSPSDNNRMEPKYDDIIGVDISIYSSRGHITRGFWQIKEGDVKSLSKGFNPTLSEHSKTTKVLNNLRPSINILNIKGD